jgi:hypothetical protein
MLMIRAMAGGAGSAQRHLEHSDYYDEQHCVQGEWHGCGAELLGLRGEVFGPNSQESAVNAAPTMVQ